MLSDPARVDTAMSAVIMTLGGLTITLYNSLH